MVNKKKKIKLIAVDLDGTLLTSDKTISDYSQNVLAKCRQQGIIIVIATARPVRVTDIYLDEINPHAKVCHNGGIAFISDEIICNYQIPPLTAHNIICKAQKKYPQIKIACDYKETLYTNFDVAKVWDDFEYTYTDYSEPFSEDVDKVIVLNEEYPDFAEYVQCLTSSDVYVDIAENSIAYFMNRKVSKHHGLSLVLKQLDISPEEVACFGDDMPDIGMIKLCGAGVAMENAKDSVKKAADYICLSNNDDGVAKWIEENVLNND